jgi:hypothetical protein
MLRIVAIALLSFAAALITAAQEKTDASANKSMILALESAGDQAEIHHNASAATAIIADTFISIDHHGVILNRSQDLAGLKDLSFKPEEIVNSDTSVYLYGDVAIATRVYRTKGKARIPESPSCIADDLPTPGSSGMENGSVSQIKRP